MIKKIIFTLLFVLTISAYSQNKEISNYKYIIVQEKFEFLKKPDQYQTSSLTKFLLQKKGFTVFLSNETLPKDLLQNRCLGLIAKVTEASSMFSVKTKIELHDCYGKLVYTSKEGKSKEKEYQKVYQDAIRKAYKTMSDVEYKYIPKEIVEEVNDKPISVKKTISTKVSKPVIKVETLYAQAKTNGFQLVNTVPTIIFQVLKTNVNNDFIIKGKNGILYKNGNVWVAEYYENNKLIKKQFDIKF
jgi:hypothetical protein